MIDHFQKWIQHSMRTHEWQDKDHPIWLSVPAYGNRSPKTKLYEEISHWNGKEMKQMSRYMVGDAIQSLRGGSPAQSPILNCAIECTQALLEIYMYARYKSDDDATWSYMDDALRYFHTFKDAFLLGRVSKQPMPNANALRTELVKKRNVDEEKNAGSWMLSMKRRGMNTWRDYISHKIDVSKELDPNINFPMIHLMSHCGQQIRVYRALHQYSAEGSVSNRSG
jgi:hypothetical protein